MLRASKPALPQIGLPIHHRVEPTSVI